MFVPLTESIQTSILPWIFYGKCAINLTMRLWFWNFQFSELEIFFLVKFSKVFRMSVSVRVLNTSAHPLEGKNPKRSCVLERGGYSSKTTHSKNKKWFWAIFSVPYYTVSFIHLEATENTTIIYCQSSSMWIQYICELTVVCDSANDQCSSWTLIYLFP